MGLAGRKQKQRIPADPRNLSWADDASRFGLSYLSKFGWDTSQGLGTSGDGMKTHLKVQQKLDMMGIGAQHQRDPNGIAWKQNKDFEALLKRLNGGEDVEARETALGNAFVREEEEEEKNDTAMKTKRKRDDDSSENTKKKRKRDRLSPAIDPPPSEPTQKSRPMAHRARIRAAKRIAGKSASAIAEILGIAPSSSASPSTTPAPEPAPVDNLTTSTKSVADYFKEKLLARSASSTPSGSTTSGLGASGSGHGPSLLDEDELPRRGIGSRAPATPPLHGVVDNNRDTLTEKQRRKAERKAKRRRRREAEAGESEERVQKSSKKEKKERKRLEGKEAPAHGEGAENKQGSEKKSKKERKKHS